MEFRAAKYHLMLVKRGGPLSFPQAIAFVKIHDGLNRSFRRFELQAKLALELKVNIDSVGSDAGELPSAGSVGPKRGKPGSFSRELDMNIERPPL